MNTTGIKGSDMVHVNCFFYTFYIKREELSKYNLTEKDIIENTEDIIKKNSGPFIKKDKLGIKNILNSLNLDFNNDFDSFSHILTVSKISEKCTSNKRKCNIYIISELFTFQHILKKLKKTDEYILV